MDFFGVRMLSMDSFRDFFTRDGTVVKRSSLVPSSVVPTLDRGRWKQDRSKGEGRHDKGLGA
jgi:hypothetical protein